MTASTAPRLTAHEWAVAVDTVLAAFWKAEGEVLVRITALREFLHPAIGESVRWERYGRRSVRTWPTTDDRAEEIARELAEIDLTYRGRQAAEEIERLDRARAEQAALREVAAEFEAEYEELCWSRFYLVTNAGGHIHASMGCSTCYSTTRFAWLPELSGLTEREAVEAHGPVLCSVCFPSAPVEWTVGRQVDTSNDCPGSGQYVQAPGKRYAKCPTCDEVVYRTSTGKLRKHAKKVG